jgi:hypothetical protein
MDVEEVGKRPGLDWSASGQGQVIGCCECGNEPFCSMKCGKFLADLWTCQLLTKDSAVWSLLVQLQFSPGHYASNATERAPRADDLKVTLLHTHTHTHGHKKVNLKSTLQTGFLTAESTRSRVHKFKSAVFPNFCYIFQTRSIIALASLKGLSKLSFNTWHVRVWGQGWPRFWPHPRDSTLPDMRRCHF